MNALNQRYGDYRWLPAAVFRHAEKWLPVPGYEGVYEISTRGQVRSMPRMREMADGRLLSSSPTAHGPIVLRSRRDHFGMPKVRLSKDGETHRKDVRRLWEEAFGLRDFE